MFCIKIPHVLLIPCGDLILVLEGCIYSDVIYELCDFLIQLKYCLVMRSGKMKTLTTAQLFKIGFILIQL